MSKVPIKNPEMHLVAVYTVNDAVLAELIRNTLVEHGIECELGGESQAGFAGTMAVEIVVQESAVKRAAEIIKTHYPHA